MNQILNNFSYVFRHPIGKKQPVRTLLRIVNWQIRSRLIRNSYEFEWISDSKLSVKRGMRGATGNLYYGLWEFPDMGFLIHFLRPGDLFFDIGANIGSYTVLAAKVCGAECWSFEPAAETLPGLRENIRLNAIEPQVQVKTCALGDTNGELTFTRGLGSMNRVAGDGDAEAEQVLVRRLDDLAGDASPIMMKIDIEGSEPAMFRGAARAMRNPALNAIIVETIDDQIAKTLDENGFVRKYYNPFERRFESEGWKDISHNKLFIRNEASVMVRLQSAKHYDVAGVRI